MGKKNVYVSVMGTMGSGKTTATKLIAGRLHYQKVEENFGENVFLPRFYKDMKRWAFHSQMFFLLEKVKQSLQIRELLSGYNVVQDTPLYEDVFSYAKAQYMLGNMDTAEWNLYNRVYSEIEPTLPKPDIIVFLSASVPELLKRIGGRGRSYEQSLDTAYIELLDLLNRDWIKKNKTIPVKMIETDDLNIVKVNKAKKNFFGLLDLPL